MASSTRRSIIMESYLLRESHPDISRAFNSPVEEGIRGAPAFDDLRRHPAMAALMREHGGEIELQLSSVRGVTVSMSLRLLGKDGQVMAECSWRAGAGISFSLRKDLPS